MDTPASTILLSSFVRRRAISCRCSGAAALVHALCVNSGDTFFSGHGGLSLAQTQAQMGVSKGGLSTGYPDCLNRVTFLLAAISGNCYTNQCFNTFLKLTDRHNMALEQEYSTLCHSVEW
jgi:hypothetical protein